jgi:hypothetical protein
MFAAQGKSEAAAQYNANDCAMRCRSLAGSTQALITTYEYSRNVAFDVVFFRRIRS